jgi:uncharacterized membrane protein YdbT with pleckstrin-like domain
MTVIESPLQAAVRSSPGVSAGTPASLPAVFRPDRSLLHYYALTALLVGPLFPVMFIIMAFRFRSLRYELDDEGITMRWGILIRREVSLTYARIQDIHLTSNVVERWLGLARIQVQTASGSASAEMTIEGLRDFERMRDFLYSRMRGARVETAAPGAAPAADTLAAAPAADELTAVLRAVAAELRALRLEHGGRRMDGRDA